ncbi:MAG: NAD(P)H-dependent oxidoreductase [Microlunatus sp.]|nr:NAD(P)H-dependent oxidoreductase [Microlunatus sp.]
MDLMLVVASVRQRRVGEAVGTWVRSVIMADDRFRLDVADLAELRLPLMDEPNHPRQRAYQAAETHAWSARVERSQGFVFVMPEYNHSFSAPLKNAIDYLFWEWHGKPVGFVSYGGLSGGSRAVTALQPVLWNLRMRPVDTNVEIAWVAKQVDEAGVFTPTEQQRQALLAQLGELAG